MGWKRRHPCPLNHYMIPHPLYCSNHFDANQHRRTTFQTLFNTNRIFDQKRDDSFVKWELRKKRADLVQSSRCRTKRKGKEVDMNKEELERWTSRIWTFFGEKKTEVWRVEMSLDGTWTWEVDSKRGIRRRNVQRGKSNEKVVDAWGKGLRRSRRVAGMPSNSQQG